MMVCPRCFGNGYLQHNERMCASAPESTGRVSFSFYGDNKQWPETPCTHCLGVGYFTGAGS